jgi:DNA-binding SARP family transcriptional activator
MTRVEVRLLGRPEVRHDGEPAPGPRGSKPWALLAYLICSERPRTRAELAELLFCEANDPMGALRWNLVEARKVLGLPHALRGGILDPELPEGVTVDVALVESGSAEAVDLPGLGQELLADLAFPDSPAFEAWLLNERSRIRHRSVSLIRHEAVRRLGRGDHDGGRRLATRLVVAEPLDEGHQALLIRAHAMAGDADAARRQHQHCRGLLMAELGIEPGPAVAAAVATVDATRGPSDVSVVDRGEVLAQIWVAWQSFLAGAVDHGIGLGRSVVTLADQVRASDLSLMARLYLGAMLSMTARSWDEASTVLNEAVALAEAAGDELSAAYATAALAGNELMRADYPAVFELANRATATSEHPLVAGEVWSFVGAAEADLGYLDDAIAHTTRGVNLLAGVDDASAEGWVAVQPVLVGWAASHAARVLLMAGQVAEAETMVASALHVSTSPMQQPWPLAIQAEIAASHGSPDVADKLARRALALATTTGVAWQRAIAERAVALASASAGDHGGAVEQLLDALGSARRAEGEGFPFHWPIAFTLDSLAEISLGIDRAGSRQWASELCDLAVASGMKEYEARARRALERTR